MKPELHRTEQPSLTRFAWLSIAFALLTIGLKGAAYWLTGSVGLLSDALESLVNLAAAIMALAMLWLAAQAADVVQEPADDLPGVPGCARDKNSHRRAFFYVATASRRRLASA